jgi:uncharacterized membrane protein
MKSPSFDVMSLLLYGWVVVIILLGLASTWVFGLWVWVFGKNPKLFSSWRNGFFIFRQFAVLLTLLIGLLTSPI